MDIRGWRSPFLFISLPPRGATSCTPGGPGCALHVLAFSHFSNAMFSMQSVLHKCMVNKCLALAPFRPVSSWFPGRLWVVHGLWISLSLSAQPLITFIPDPESQGAATVCPFPLALPRECSRPFTITEKDLVHRADRGDPPSQGPAPGLGALGASRICSGTPDLTFEAE